MTPAQARRALKQAATNAGSIQQVADILGVSKSTVSLVIRGKRGVGLALSKRIEDKFQIPHLSWIPISKRSAA